jgi:hypothetical protein
LLLLLFLLPFTWGRHHRARATTALPGASSLYTCSSMTKGWQKSKQSLNKK